MKTFRIFSDCDIKIQVFLDKTVIVNVVSKNLFLTQEITMINFFFFNLQNKTVNKNNYKNEALSDAHQMYYSAANRNLTHVPNN